MADRHFGWKVCWEGFIGSDYEIIPNPNSCNRMILVVLKVGHKIIMSCDAQDTFNFFSRKKINVQVSTKKKNH